MANILCLWAGTYMGWKCHGIDYERSVTIPGLSQLSAILKKEGHYVTAFDCRKMESFEDACELLANSIHGFDCVLVSCLSVDKKTVDDLIRMIKTYREDIPVIIGGAHVTYEQCEKFSKADCVVRGEGEPVILDLIAKIENGEQLPAFIDAPMVQELDSLPFVDRELFDQKVENAHPFLPCLPPPLYTIMFSRGCLNSCTFCLQSKKGLMWKKYRMRSPENCIAEIKTLMPIGDLQINDDLFAGRREWTERFINMWNKEELPRIPFWCQMRGQHVVEQEDLIPKLAKIGLTWVSIAWEGSQKMIDFYNKRTTVEEVIRGCDILHDNNVNIFGNYIMGSPTETKEDLIQLEEIIKRVKPERHSPSIYTAYPGSILYDYCVKNDLFVGTDVNDSANHYSMVRFPYERRIRGIDYQKIFDLRNQWTSKYTGTFREYQA